MCLTSTLKISARSVHARSPDMVRYDCERFWNLGMIVFNFPRLLVEANYTYGLCGVVVCGGGVRWWCVVVCVYGV